MAAKEYRLCISPLSGTVFISKVSKKSPNVMLDDRMVVEESEFIHQLLQWVEVRMEGKGEMNITEGDKVILRIVKPDQP